MRAFVRVAEVVEEGLEASKITLWASNSSPSFQARVTSEKSLISLRFPKTVSLAPIQVLVKRVEGLRIELSFHCPNITSRKCIYFLWSPHALKITTATTCFFMLCLKISMQCYIASLPLLVSWNNQCFISEKYQNEGASLSMSVLGHFFYVVRILNGSHRHRRGFKASLP